MDHKLDIVNILNTLAALPVEVLIEAMQDVTRPMCDRSAVRTRAREVAKKLLVATGVDQE